jgi:hypothetical protein
MPVRSASSPQRIRPVAGQVRTASLALKRQSGSDPTGHKISFRRAHVFAEARKA